MQVAVEGYRLPRAVACQKWEQRRGETRKQDFSALRTLRRVKVVVFREVRGSYFWLDFLVTFSSKEKVTRKN
jgi:hypothetical protein